MLLTATLSFCVATVVGVFAAHSSIPWLLVATLPAGLLWPGCRRLPWACVLACALAGLMFGLWRTDTALTRRVDEAGSGQPLTVQGQVVGLVREMPPAKGVRPMWRYRFVLHCGAFSPGLAGRRLQVSAYSQQRLRLQPGEWVRVLVRVRPPRGLVNQYGPDSERLALSRGIDGYATVLRWLRRRPGMAGLDRWRQQLSGWIRQQVPAGSPAAAIVPALVSGDRQHLDMRQWQVLQRLGLSHLVAISGLHISLLAGLVWWLTSHLLALLWAQGDGARTASRWALLPAAATALTYAALAGFAVPTRRALIMLLVVMLAQLLRWQSGLAARLMVALAVVLLMDPLASLSAGFWMSFLAVALLALVWTSGAAGRWRLQLVLSLAGGLVAGWLFGVWSLVAVPANLILVPVFSLVLIPLALAGSLVPGLAVLLRLDACLLNHLWPLLEAASVVPTLPVPASLLAAGLLLLALLRWLLPAWPGPRWLWLLCLLPWLLPHTAGPAQAAFDLVVFDVGQGQMTLVRTRHHLLLYDTGPAWTQGSAVADLLRPWLAHQHLSLTLAWVSHGDADHSGGAADLRHLYPAVPLFSGEPQRVAGSLPCRRGQHWRFDGVSVRVMWPPPGLVLRHSNNRSCVIRVSSRYGSVLLDGDIEKPVEYWLLQQRPRHVDVLQVAHHGSRTSSSYAWLRALTPRQAAVTSGYRNRFGHPDARTRARYRQEAIPLHNTADTGMQVYHLDATADFSPQLWRQQSSWPWRLPTPVIE